MSDRNIAMSEASGAAKTNRIDQRLAKLREEGGTALIPFITAGDPNMETTEAIILVMAEAGADVIEIGVPFSDPTAEGPTIQRSSKRALEQGTSLRGILQMVARIRDRVEQPLVLMGYANPVHAMGAEAFAAAAAEVGVDGIIIPDLTPEDGAAYLDPSRDAGIHPILLAAPTTRADRLEMLVKETRGFLYYVSVQGVTGARSDVADGIEAKVKHAQSLSDMPVCVGFGVGTPEQAATIGAYADGVVVGSAIVDLIEAADSDASAVDDVGRFISELKAAMS